MVIGEVPALGAQSLQVGHDVGRQHIGAQGVDDHQHDVERLGRLLALQRVQRVVEVAVFIAKRHLSRFQLGGRDHPQLDHQLVGGQRQVEGEAGLLLGHRGVVDRRGPGVHAVGDQQANQGQRHEPLAMA